MVNPGSSFDIAIVGAGLSGLFLANRLILGGHRVTVYEGLTRPGGRILTERDPLDGHLYAEAGAEGIAAADDAVIELAENLGLSLDIPDPSNFSPGRMWVQVGGKRFSLAEAHDDPSLIPFDLSPRERAGFPHSLLAGAIRATAVDLLEEDRTALKSNESLRLQGLSLEQFVAEDAGGQSTLRAIEALSPFAVYPASDVAAYWALAQEYRAYGGGSVSTIEGGSDRLVTALAGRLEGAIKFNHRVSEVRRSDEGIALATTAHGKFYHDIVVLTGTPAALQSMVLDLPDEPCRAIGRFKPGSLLKVHLRFRERFWEDHNWSGAAWTDHEAGYVWHSTEGQKGVSGVLTCFVPGSRALQAAAYPAGPVQFCLTGIQRLTPDARKHFEVGWWHDWARDELIRSAVFYLAPGEVERTLEALSQPYGPIYIAGDHTTPQGGYMVGALNSALRVEDQIRKAARTSMGVLDHV